MSSQDDRLRRAHEAAAAKGSEPTPFQRPLNIIHFAVTFLGLRLYPIQATILKAITLDVEALTPFDQQVIAEWESGFVPTRDDDRHHWSGTRGCAPGLVARMRHLRDRGGHWFTEVVFVQGRRAGKGFIVSVLVAWHIWKLLGLEDPHDEFGIDSNKQINILLFSVNTDQVKRDQFADVKALLLSAPALQGRLGRCTSTMVSILTDQQLKAGARPGITEGLIAVRAAQTTESAARGAAVAMFVLDEVAHVAGAGSTSDANSIYRAVAPAATPFRAHRLAVLSSSPAEKTGPQYAAYQRALQIDPATGEAANPNTFMIQGCSWDSYRGWERAYEIEMWPGGPCFEPISRSIIDAEDEDVVLLRLADPETHAVEYEGHFRATRNAYLDLDVVTGIFGTFQNRVLQMQTKGSLAVVYYGHADPSVSGANFGLAIGHLEWVDDERMPNGKVAHVMFDLLHAWYPADFEGGRIDYIEVEDDLVRRAAGFNLSRLTLDQFNSAGAIQRIDQRLRELHLPKTCVVEEVTATAKHNWQAAELFKTAAGLGLIHAPDHTLARLELEYLQCERQRVFPQTSGDVRTSDITDPMFEVTFALYRDQAPDLFARLAGLSPRGSQPGGFPKSIDTHADPVHQALSGFGRRVNRRRPGKQGG